MRRLDYIFLTYFVIICISVMQVAYAQQTTLPGRFQIAKKLSKADMQKAKELMDGYFKKNRGHSSSSSGASSPSIPSLVDKPNGFLPTPPRKNLNPAKLGSRDKMFIKVHMKLANRHFKKKDLNRAVRELEQIFERAPTLSSGRFMRAVIAARTKDYLSAWRNIEIARKGNPDGEKIQAFVNRLEGVFPRPKTLPQIKGIYRNRPVCATQLAMDALERLFQEQLISNVNHISFTDFKEGADKIVGNLKVTGSKALPKDKFAKSLNDILGGELPVVQEQDGGKTLQIEVAITGLPLANPKPKPVSSIPEFMKMVSEETDVAIQESAESTPDSSGTVIGNYSVVARNLLFLNNFLRKIAPYASRYNIAELYPDYLSSRVVIKGKIQVTFKMEEED